MASIRPITSCPGTRGQLIGKPLPTGRKSEWQTPNARCGYALDRGQDRPAVSLRLRILPVSLLGLLYTLHSYRLPYGEPFGFARARTFPGESAIPINNPHGCSSSSQENAI